MQMFVSFWFVAHEDEATVQRFLGKPHTPVFYFCPRGDRQTQPRQNLNGLDVFPNTARLHSGEIRRQ